MLANQHPTGSFVASPDFPEYQYCWLRDGSFIACALDRAGETDAANNFHLWAASALAGVGELMAQAAARHGAGLPLESSMMPPARFSLAGSAVADDWPNFQVDGYGTWLWSVERHLQAAGAGALPSALAPAVDSAARYIAAVGQAPCYDVWEESGDHVHTSTLACVYGGLAAASRLLADDHYAEVAGQLRQSLTERAREQGYFYKSDHSDQVDGSLLWLCEPFQVVAADDASFVETVRRIIADLQLEGGIRRYPDDVYYGSGAWPVLTASLGWVNVASGDLAGACERLDWVAGHVDEQGRLAEQFGGERRDPEHYEEWARRWGPPAADLVWSHAMYVVLAAEVAAGRLNSPGPPLDQDGGPPQTRTNNPKEQYT